eukprot:TRINITY_DN1461_c0_g1_i1.p1 TRINITY_DN1461_c0_g1~~TRINITY_DN1461_c0_g1_i1.p1  ORF type:complete len:162 (-),score=15.88 TRINITY_DN1461_c0_g1_i1:482-967(-)
MEVNTFNKEGGRSTLVGNWVEEESLRNVFGGLPSYLFKDRTDLRCGQTMTWNPDDLKSVTQLAYQSPPKECFTNQPKYFNRIQRKETTTGSNQTKSSLVLGNDRCVEPMQSTQRASFQDTRRLIEQENQKSAKIPPITCPSSSTTNSTTVIPRADPCTLRL